MLCCLERRGQGLETSSFLKVDQTALHTQEASKYFRIFKLEFFFFFFFYASPPSHILFYLNWDGAGFR